MHLFNIWNENQLMSLFYSYIAGSLHVSGPQATAHTQNTGTERHRNWTNGCVNSCTNSTEDGPVGPKYVEIQQYTNKIVTSVGFHSITCSKSGMNPVPLNARVQRDKCHRHLQPHQFFWVQLPVRAQLGLIDNVAVKVTDVWVLW